jgi:hypothetical protein
MSKKKKIYFNEDDFLHKGVSLYTILGVIHKIIYRDMFTKQCRIKYVFEEVLSRRQ